MLVHVGERRPQFNLWNLDRDADRLFRRFWSDWGFAPQPEPFAARTDREGATLRAELPGVDPKSVTVSVENRTLTISGERPTETHTDGVYRVRERHAGKFSRSFRLPETLDTERISADCRHGVLTVRIPTRTEAAPRQIEVKAS